MKYTKEQKLHIEKLMEDCCTEYKTVKEPTLDKRYAETITIETYKNGDGDIEYCIKKGSIYSGICSIDRYIVKINLDNDIYKLIHDSGSYSFDYPSDESEKLTQFDDLSKLLNTLNSKFSTFDPIIKYVNSLEID